MRIGEPGMVDGDEWVYVEPSNYASRPPTNHRVGAVAYIGGILLATTAGTLLVMAAILSGLGGLLAVIIAAGFPVAGFVWAVSIAKNHRSHADLQAPPDPPADGHRR